MYGYLSPWSTVIHYNQVKEIVITFGTGFIVGCACQALFSKRNTKWIHWFFLEPTWFRVTWPWPWTLSHDYMGQDTLGEMNGSILRFFSKNLYTATVNDSATHLTRNRQNYQQYTCIKIMILMNTCFNEAWRWLILQIDYRAHSNLIAVNVTGHIAVLEHFGWRYPLQNLMINQKLLTWLMLHAETITLTSVVWFWAVMAFFDSFFTLGLILFT